MRHAVAQQVFEGADHPFEHTAVDLDRAADDVEPDLLAGLFRGLANGAVQAVGHALELDHARAQQVVLELTRQPRLRGEFVFRRLQGALQAALQRGHVVDRLGHETRQLLEAREAVHLQRVEVLRRGLGGFHARIDLRFGLQLDVAQLLAHAVQAVGQLAERCLQHAHVGVDAGARDAHLTGLVDEAVEQAGAHAHRSATAGAADAVFGDDGFVGTGEARPVDDGRHAGCGRGRSVPDRLLDLWARNRRGWHLGLVARNCGCGGLGSARGLRQGQACQ